MRRTASRVIVLRMHYSQSHTTDVSPSSGRRTSRQLDVCYDVELGRYGVSRVADRRRDLSGCAPPRWSCRQHPPEQEDPGRRRRGRDARVLRRLPADVDGERVRAAVRPRSPSCRGPSLPSNRRCSAVDGRHRRGRLGARRGRTACSGRRVGGHGARLATCRGSRCSPVSCPATRPPRSVGWGSIHRLTARGTGLDGLSEEGCTLELFEQLFDHRPGGG